jgi:hypothetical protein
MATRRMLHSISTGLAISCLLVCHPAVAEEPAPQKIEKRDEVWLWTMGPELNKGWAKTNNIPTEAVCSAEQLIEFYGARRVMYFEDGAHKPEVAKRFARADKLILSCGYVLGGKSGTLESLGPCPNLAGIIIDDFSPPNVAHYTPDSLAGIHSSLKKRGADLKLYAVIYTRDLDLDYKPYLPSIDVVSLWVWERKDLPDLDRHLEHCRKIFPGKPIVLGLYVYDYSKSEFMPLDLLQFEFRKARDCYRRGLIDGYQVLGSYFLKELQTPQARWVRDFIQEGKGEH